MIILVDTTALIDALRRKRFTELWDAVNQGHSLSTSVINLAELYAGMRAGEEQDTMALIGGLECYAVTVKIAQMAGIMQRTWRARGRTLQLPDMLVAATALDHGLPLMTNNRKDFPIPELRFYPEVLS